MAESIENKGFYRTHPDFATERTTEVPLIFISKHIY